MFTGPLTVIYSVRIMPLLKTSYKRDNSAWADGLFFCYVIPVNGSQINQEQIGNGKVTTVQAWRGPGGYMTLRLPDFKTIGT
jgi:hypothetical protein